MRIKALLISVTVIASCLFSAAFAAESGSAALFDVDERNRFFSSDRGALFDRDRKTLLVGYPLVHGGVCVIPETVTSIGYAAFDCCTSLKEMRIHASVTDIEENAFDECGFVYFTVNRRNQYYYSTRYGELIKYRCCGLS